MKRCNSLSLLVTFHKVVYQHTWGVVGSLVTVLLQIFSLFWQQNNSENWVIFDKVTAYKKIVPEFLATLYMRQSVWFWFWHVVMLLLMFCCRSGLPRGEAVYCHFMLARLNTKSVVHCSPCSASRDQYSLLSAVERNCHLTRYVCVRTVFKFRGNAVLVLFQTRDVIPPLLGDLFRNADCSTKTN